MLSKIHKQAKTDPVDIIYRSVPGIGALSARILSNELGDMKSFANEKGLFSYTGLTPSEYSSGEHKHLGSISRQGRSFLRMILVQVAWNYVVNALCYKIPMQIKSAESSFINAIYFSSFKIFIDILYQPLRISRQASCFEEKIREDAKIFSKG